MRTFYKRLWAALAGAGLLLTIPLAAQELEEPDIEQPRTELELSVALEQYLKQDCGTGDPNPRFLLERVIEFGDQAVEPLRLAATRGPSAKTRGELEEAARTDFRRMKEFIEADGLEGLEEDEVVKDARQLDQETYLSQRVEGFGQAYRERALNALEAIGTPKAQETLEELSQSPDLPENLQSRAREMLKAPKQ